MSFVLKVQIDELREELELKTSSKSSNWLSIMLLKYFVVPFTTILPVNRDI